MACPDCRPGGPCARCLAEQHPDGLTFSKLNVGDTEVHIPNFGSQEWVQALTCAAIADGRERQGFAP